MARLMHDHRLRSRVVRKYQTITPCTHSPQENVLNQTFTAERPHVVWMKIFRTSPPRKDGSLEQDSRTCTPEKLWDERWIGA